MAKSNRIITAVLLIVVLFLVSTIVSPVLIVAEDAAEGNPGIDMAATIGITGFNWIYPGSSHNAQGQTLHNIHVNHPEDPYGAARDIMTYTYHVTPHLVVSINNDAANAIFGEGIIGDIRANDGYNGYSGQHSQGSMSRGGAVSTAILENGINMIEIPIQILMGNISFHIV